MEHGLSPLQWGVLAALTLVFVLGEGRSALQRRWGPAVLDRARGLRRRSSAIRLLAPLHGLGLVGTARPTLLRAWGTTGAIVAAVLVVRSFPEPGRGITDFAVAAALAWGVGALLLRAPEVLGPVPDPDHPGGSSPTSP